MRLLAAILAAAVALCAGARDAGADIAPEGLRGCEGKAAGEPCFSDGCAAGRCVTTRCKQARPECDLCFLEHLVRDGGACDPSCSEPSPIVDCQACAPPGARDFWQPGDPYRWDDCREKAEGQPCRTVDCNEGACAVPEGGDALVCLTPSPAPAGRIAAAAVTLLGIGIAAAAVVRHRARRGRGNDRPG